MNKEKVFIENKKKSLLKLIKAKKDFLVDKKIIPILDIINNSDNYFTTSSCFGRIVVLQIPNIGNKKEAEFLGKWHREINLEDIKNSLEKFNDGQLWLLAQSPIIHIIAKTIEDAEKILKLAFSCGFKNSGIRSIGKRIVVEICSTERLDAPIGYKGNIFCNDDYLDFLVKISNQIINKSTNKLNIFENKIKKDLSTQKTTNL